MNTKKSSVALLAIIVFMVMYVGCANVLQRDSANPVSTETKSSHQSHGLPMPNVAILDKVVKIPFTIDPKFPAPVVQVKIDGRGPFSFVIDTGMSASMLVRKKLADSFNFATVGYAMGGDGSLENMIKVPLIMIDSVVVDKLVLTDIISVAMEPSVDHNASIPENLDGILGMKVFSEHILTIDYPEKEIRIQEKPDDHMLQKDFIPYSYEKEAIEIQVDISGNTIPLYVDSGHRGTITLPKSYSEILPLSESLKPIGKIATVSNTYTREKSTLSASVRFSGHELLNPPIVFTDEHSPKLLGYGVLEYFEITIDQKNKLIRFARASSDPIKDVTLVKEHI